MNQCTCTKDAQITCIVHPTEQALKARIASLEAENQRLRDELTQWHEWYFDGSDTVQTPSSNA